MRGALSLSGQFKTAVAGATGVYAVEGAPGSRKEAHRPELAGCRVESAAGEPTIQLKSEARHHMKGSYQNMKTHEKNQTQNKTHILKLVWLR